MKKIKRDMEFRQQAAAALLWYGIVEPILQKHAFAKEDIAYWENIVVYGRKHEQKK